MFGCETWSLNVKEKRRFEGVCKQHADLKVDVTVSYGKPHNEEFHNLKSPTNVRGIKGRSLKGTRKVKHIWKLTMLTKPQSDNSNGVRMFGKSIWRLKYDINLNLKACVVMWNRFIWVRVQITGELLTTQY